MVIEHIIAGYSIPHNEGAVPLTKEAYDVNNPQKRLTDFSKTITIPENRIVNQIFEHAFDVNIDLQTFNPNLKTSYQIIQDGITAIDGYCQLKAISNVDGLINYEIQATGKIGNLFEKIRDKYLQDLDLSSLDHTWTETNVVNSWTATIGQGYEYPCPIVAVHLLTIFVSVQLWSKLLRSKSCKYLSRIFSNKSPILPVACIS